MTKKDYYEVLGISRQANAEEIKRAFRSKARNLHPDNKQSGDEIAFKELAESYEVLSDEQKRSLYDRFGHDGVKGSGHSFDNFDFSTFSGFGVDELLESFFGGGLRNQRRNGPQPGSHLQYELHIEFLEAVFGVEKTINIKRQEECDDCKGTGAAAQSKVITCSTCSGAGQVQQVINSWFGQSIRVSECPSCQGSGKRIEKPCRSCHGLGLLKKSNEFSLKIPAGIDSGTRMRMPLGGDKGKNGGAFGDLFVFIRVKDHDQFIRDGENIFIKQNISFSLAALGGELSVPTVDGEKKLKIPVGTQTGTIMILKNSGIPRLNNPSRRGDQLVELNIETPVKLSSEEKKLFERLALLRSEMPSLPQEPAVSQSTNDSDKEDTSIIDKIVEAFKPKDEN